MKKSQNNLTDAEILRQKAEEQLKKQQSKVSLLSSENDLRKLAHELLVHQIELEMQYEQLKKSKEEADAATEKYTELYDFAPSGYFTLTKLGEIIRLNLHGASLLGKERLGLINRRFGSSVSDQTKSIFNNFLDKVFTSKIIESCEVTLTTGEKNAQTNVYLTGHVLINGEQCQISVVDITKRKQVEEELKNKMDELTIANKELLQSEKNFRRSISKSPLGIRIVSIDGETIYANKAFLDIFELNSLEEFTSIPAINLYTPESYAQHQKRKEKRKNGHDVFDYEISIIRANAGIRHIKIWRREVLWNGNKHYQVINLDITEQKKLTIALIAAKEQAEGCDRLKSAFLANMSHEIRTPMNGILGFTELLKEPNLSSDDQQDFIQIIQISGARMLNTINNIVDFSKIESGLSKVDIKETNINEKIEFTYKFFKPEVKIKGLQFLFKNSLPSKEAIIKTDNEKIYGILTNLVKNAIKFTYEGTIEFGYEKKGEYLEFFVKDTGVGIPKNQTELIFERFRQGSESYNRNYEGSGLGLSIAKSYVEMLGGEIWVESEEGKGSIFYFTIPYNPVSEETHTIENVGFTENKEVQVKKLKILIVEDDGISYSLLTRMLQKISKEVLHAKTGVEAIEFCHNNPDLDLVLMDIKMPVMDGHEATRQIRQFNTDVIIIAQTAYGFSGDREKAIEAGCNDYISKPINYTLLHELIKKHCNK
jgi:PAS domain S-box-containing protein